MCAGHINTELKLIIILYKKLSGAADFGAYSLKVNEQSLLYCHNVIQYTVVIITLITTTLKIYLFNSNQLAKGWGFGLDGTCGQKYRTAVSSF